MTPLKMFLLRSPMFLRYVRAVPHAVNTPSAVAPHRTLGANRARSARTRERTVTYTNRSESVECAEHTVQSIDQNQSLQNNEIAELTCWGPTCCSVAKSASSPHTLEKLPPEISPIVARRRP